jgi:cell shape-determining protein MreD
MSNPLIKNIVRFIILVIIQVFILNNIRINGYINPYLYVLFILLLPFETPGWLLLVSSFLLGLAIDIFSHTPGMNTAASVFMAFCRPGIIRLLSGSKMIDPGVKPGIRDMGFRWFFLYSLFLVLLHHFVLFYIEVFRFSEFFQTMYRVFFSTLATLILIILFEFLFLKKESRD